MQEEMVAGRNDRTIVRALTIMVNVMVQATHDFQRTKNVGDNEFCGLENF